MGAMASAVASAGHLVAGEAVQAAVACEVSVLQAVAPAGTTITAARTLAAGGACQVEGHAASPGNTVNFRLALPPTWNNRFLFLGVGGLGGSIANVEPGAGRGYATASTDTGHVSSDPAWAANRAKEIDYGYRGTHVATVATKALTAAYYGTPARYAYFSGCSNGGRQALMEVQRYPDDFDGVIGGHPATGTPMQVGRAIVYQTMLATAANYLPAGKIALVARASLAACDKADGVEDGLVSDPGGCRFDPVTLACGGSETAQCLTAGQLATVRQIYAGVKTPDGRTYAHGFPPGHEDGRTGWGQWITGSTPPVAKADGTLAYTGPALPSGYGLMDFNFRQLALEVDDPSFTWRVFDPARDLDRMQLMTEILSPLDADLRGFRQSGGKLLMYHGWSDPGISAFGTLDYYNRVVTSAGGQAEADRFVRAYFVPGMHHCGGGPGPNQFDLQPAIEAWVEQGVPPGAVLATTAPEHPRPRTRPLCPHPQVATYGGSGSVDEAANFRCR